MNTYLIQCDLRKPDKDYGELAETIKGLGDWWHHLEFTWLVKHDGTPKEVRDVILPHLGPSDRLLVLNVAKQAAWAGLNEKASQWLMDCL